MSFLSLNISIRALTNKPRVSSSHSACCSSCPVPSAFLAPMTLDEAAPVSQQTQNTSVYHKTRVHRIAIAAQQIQLECMSLSPARRLPWFGPLTELWTIPSICTLYVQCCHTGVFNGVVAAATAHGHAAVQSSDGMT